MNAPTRLGAFGVAVAVVFAGAVGLGQLVGPDIGGSPTPAAADGHDDHGGSDADPKPATTVPGGLQVAQDGYRLVPETTTFEPGVSAEFRFTVEGPDGRAVTRFATEHEKKLHLIVAGRDLSGYQHLHPVMADDGVWSTRLTLPAAGNYRAFADFRAAGAADGVTLGVDLFVPGQFEPVPLPKPEPVSAVGDYTVAVDGDLVPGRSSTVTLSVREDGQPVRDLQPYLGAYGHLVALRRGDLAYAHVHPEGTPGDGATEPGPRITYQVEVPSAGTYRLYLDFRHAGVVRTAEFTAVAGPRADDVEPTEPDGAAGHGH